MGRKRNPIKDDGPIGKFAAALRERINRDDPELTYRQIAGRVNYSHAALAAAASGKSLPTWEVTCALLQGCGADSEEIDQFREYWQATRLLRDGGAVATAEMSPLGWVEPTLDRAGFDQWRPRPDQVQTFAQLAFELGRLRAAVGNPPLRELHRMMLLHANGTPCSVTTLSGILKGKRRPKVEIYRLLLKVLLLKSNAIHSTAELDRPWRAEHHWAQAWNRAVYDRDLAARAPDTGGPARPATTADRDESALRHVASRMPREAATLLAEMEPSTISGLLAELPQESAMKILTAVLEQQQHRIKQLLPTRPRGR